MKLKIFKQIAFLLMAGLIGLGTGVVIMWGGHNTSAAGESGHGHALTIHLGAEATCETTGLKTYWECPECHLYFSDAEGLNPIPVDELDAWRVIPKIAHKTKFYAQKNATCAEDGNYAYYHCVCCGRDFKDEVCKVEFAANEIVIESYHQEHNKVKVNATAPTCEHDGCYEHYKCTKCGQVFNEYGIACRESDVVIKGGHYTDDAHFVEYEAATCEHAGRVAHYECVRCGKKFADSECKSAITDETIPQLNHWSDGSAYHVHEKAATCTEDGNPEYWICTKGCGKKYTDQTCQYLLDESLFDNYKALNHGNGSGWKIICTPDCRVDNTVPYRYEDANTYEVVVVDARYCQTCIYCGEHQGGQPVRSYAELDENNFNRNHVTYSYEITGENRVISCDVLTIAAGAIPASGEGYAVDILINVAANYSAYSKYKCNGDIVTDMSSDVYKQGGKNLMALKIHFDELPTANTEQVWEFDWDGDNQYEQKIKVVVLA